MSKRIVLFSLLCLSLLYSPSSFAFKCVKNTIDDHEVELLIIRSNFPGEYTGTLRAWIADNGDIEGFCYRDSLRSIRRFTTAQLKKNKNLNLVYLPLAEWTYVYLKNEDFNERSGGGVSLNFARDLFPEPSDFRKIFFKLTWSGQWTAEVTDGDDPREFDSLNVDVHTFGFPQYVNSIELKNGRTRIRSYDPAKLPRS